MKDYSNKFRKKNKFVFELRYDPKLQLLDKKGEIIESLQDDIKNRYPHWGVNQSEITFQDSLELPKDIFIIGMKRTSIIVEDISSFEDFKNNVVKQIKKVYEILNITKVKRIGFRIISTYSLPNLNSFDDARNKIEETFLKDPINLGLKHKDLFLKIDHDNGFYTVGPIKENENWLKQHFKDFSNNNIKFGYAFDIDSYGLDFDIKDQKAILSKSNDTLLLSKSIEDAIIKSLEN